MFQSLRLPAAPRCSQHRVNGPVSPFPMGGASGASQAGPRPIPAPTHGQPCSLRAGPCAGHPRHLREVGTVLPLRRQDQ